MGRSKENQFFISRLLFQFSRNHITHVYTSPSYVVGYVATAHTYVLRTCSSTNKVRRDQERCSLFKMGFRLRPLWKEKSLSNCVIAGAAAKHVNVTEKGNSAQLASYISSSRLVSSEIW